MSDRISNTQDVYKEIESICNDRFDDGSFDVVFEHNQWWVYVTTNNFSSLYAVVDCKDRFGNEYLDFEEIDTVEL